MNRPPSALGLPGRIGRYAPIQFAGPAAILVALIIFTPVLLATGPPALAVQAELTLYRVNGGKTTEFYLHAVGSDVPYTELTLDYGTNFSWSGACPSTGVVWNHTTATNLLELGISVPETTFVVNATAVYGVGSGRTVYAGMLAVNITHVDLPDETVQMVACPATTPGMTVPGSWSVSKLPVSLLLVNYGAGGPP